MKDGQIGVIAEWSNDYHIGEIVMRHGNSLIAVGMASDYSWSGIFYDIISSNRVRLLHNDEPLYVDNDKLVE